MTEEQRNNIVYSFAYSGIILGCLIFLFWVIPAYTPPYPGYGMPASLLPNIAVGIILAFSVLELVRHMFAYFSAKSDSEEEEPDDTSQVGRVNFWHLAKFMVPCILLMPAIQWIGFVPAGIAFMLVIQFICGRRKPIPALAVALGTVLLIYVALRYGLGVPLP